MNVQRTFRPPSVKSLSTLSVYANHRIAWWWIGVTLLTLLLTWQNLTQLTSDLCYLTAKQLFEAGYTQSALWLANQAQHIPSEQSLAYNMAGYILYTIDDIPASKRELETGMRTGVANPPLFNNLAVLNHGPQEIEKAIKLQQQAVDGAPNTAVPYYNLGVLYWLDDDQIAAIRALREATRIDSKWAPPYLYLSFIYMVRQEYAVAERLAQEAILLQPDQSIGHELYIQALLSQQKGDRAFAAISTARPQIKDRDRKNLYYALALRAQGEIKSSQFLFEKLFMWTADRSVRYRAAVELRSIRNP